MDEILKEWVKNAGGRLRLKDALILVQAHEGCSREPAYRKLRWIVNWKSWLQWDRPSPRKVYIVYRPEYDPEAPEWQWSPKKQKTQVTRRDAHREKLLRLKAEAWEKRDYQRVKELRILIKEYDAQQPKEKVQPYRLFEKIER